MLLRKGSSLRAKAVKTEIKPNIEKENAIVAFIISCIDDTYDTVFTKAYEEFFELHILEDNFNFITDDNLKKIILTLVKVKTSIGTILSKKFSIDRIDRIKVKSFDEDKESTGWVFKIKWNDEFKLAHQTAHPNEWDSGKSTIPDAE